MKQSLFLHVLTTLLVGLHLVHSAHPDSLKTCPRIMFGFPKVDGTCNHVAAVDGGYGVAGAQQIRLALGDHASSDGFGFDSIRTDHLPSPRLVSNLLVHQPDFISKSSRGMSVLLAFMGQFIDHDITLTITNDADPDGILIPPRDPLIESFPNGKIPFSRSEFVRSNFKGPRQFENQLTSFLDLSTVYGAKEDTSRKLRALDGTGMLKYSVNRFGEMILPLQKQTGVEVDLKSAKAFGCGDKRCNEQIMLTCFHTLFVKEHNRLAQAYRNLYPHASDDEIFDQARLQNIRQYQRIIYEEWLPLVLGQSAIFNLIGSYRGYNPNVDPSMSLFFSTVAFRFGHSLIPDELECHDDRGNLVGSGRILVSDTFEKPELVQNDNRLSWFFNGAWNLLQEELDRHVVDSLRENLFKNEFERFDLIAFNIQRGRDHNLGTFNSYRSIFGARPIRCHDPTSIDCFEQLTLDRGLAELCQSLYGHFDRLDNFVAALMERPDGDSLLGELMTRVVADQFQRLRDGDRYFYDQRPLHARSAWARGLEAHTFADVMRYNMPDIIRGPRQSAFLSPRLNSLF
jgi:hypothetical protein